MRLDRVLTQQHQADAAKDTASSTEAQSGDGRTAGTVRQFHTEGHQAGDPKQGDCTPDPEQQRAPTSKPKSHTETIETSTAAQALWFPQADCGLGRTQSGFAHIVAD